MLRQTPPLAATEAFLVAARAPSFRVAARSLALSPSAFSRRIQLLEAFLGTALFDRSGASAELTAVGRQYLIAIEPAIDTIRRASLRVRRPVDDALRIATSHSLAAEWLIPRLAEVIQELGLEIEVVVTHDRKLLRDGEVDVALWGGREPEHGEGEMIVTLDAVPVTANRLADGRPPPRTVADLVTHRLLAVRNPPDVWPRWFDTTGYEGRAPDIAALFDSNQLLYESVAGGLGVTLAVPLLANRYVADGRLTPCICAPRPIGFAYWLNYPSPAQRKRSVLVRLADWLRTAANETKQIFEGSCREALA
ncbi:transcriptional regulator GcvA [soil metagenome]